MVPFAWLRVTFHPGQPTMTRLLRALTLLALLPASLPAQSDDAGRLVAALLGDTPMTSDLETLTDRIGGRPTGSEANQRAFEWALERFKEAGVQARKEPFQMPGLWLERSARATVKGRGVTFAARVAALPFSTAAREPGLTAPLVDAGHGAEADFAALGARAKGAFVLVETEELRDLDGLFREYMEAGHIERRAIAAGAAGLVYMSSRPGNTLARHNASLGWANRHPMMMMERDAAARALRLLRGGTALTLTAVLEVRSGPAYTAHNVIGEIRGSTLPDEIVVIGAHLDSWDLGTGALDNGADRDGNRHRAADRAAGDSARADDPVRAVERRGQNLNGSYGYTLSHAAEMDKHVMASSYDIGTGRITGYFTGGRADMLPVLDARSPRWRRSGRSRTSTSP